MKNNNEMIVTIAIVSVVFIIGAIIMGILFEDLKEGLQEAIDFEKGDGEAKTTTVDNSEKNNK